ncbi:NB-ARC domain-containing protein [Saccharopolyspora sp. CA-218241]|uniref:NB-ARC domain-containing protein n=1 Tax=Saccharopolyspora sp. CA-218241 TaxID=3240027 RepID=UPI003D9941DD
MDDDRDARGDEDRTAAGGAVNVHSGDARLLVQAGSVSGGVHVHVPSEPAVPRELLAAPPHFVDRVGAVAALDAVESGFAVISGIGGVGKTALAAHWGNAVRERFPGGDVFCPREVSRLGLDAVVRRCLWSLGERDVPDDPGTALALFRSRTARDPVLVVVDDAADPAEFLDLRTGSGMVLVTTNERAEELIGDGVVPVALELLAHEDALEYLRRCGVEVDEEPAAVAELIRLCGRLPLALRVVAGRLNHRRRRQVQRLVEELAEERTRLDRMVLRKEPVVRVALDFVFDDLPEAESELYQVLGLFPGEDFCPEAVAVLAELTVRDATDRLDDLHDIGLLTQDDRQQYRFHALIRAHAQAHAALLSADHRADALRRLVDWYRLHGAYCDRKVMEPSRLRIADDDVSGENPYTEVTALEWLERERLNLLAVLRISYDRGWYQDVIALCDGPLWALHQQHKHYADTVRAFRLGVEAAQRARLSAAEARLRSLCAQLLVESGDPVAAEEESAGACRIAERAGHRRVLASALEFHGKVRAARGEHAEAIGLFERAAELNAGMGRPRGVALQEYLIGRSLHRLGRDDEALHSLRGALDRLTAFPDDRRTPARISTAIGRIHLGRGEHEQALAALEPAIASVRGRGASFDLAEPLVLLADALTALGRPGARPLLEEALTIYDQAGSAEAERVRQRLTD